MFKVKITLATGATYSAKAKTIGKALAKLTKYANGAAIQTTEVRLG